MIPLFLLMKKAQKKKLSKKKSAVVKEFRHLRVARRASRPPLRKLLKKLDQNFSKKEATAELGGRAFLVASPRIDIEKN